MKDCTDVRTLLKTALQLAYHQERKELYAAIMLALIEDRRERLKAKIAE